MMKKAFDSGAGFSWVIKLGSQVGGAGILKKAPSESKLRKQHVCVAIFVYLI